MKHRVHRLGNATYEGGKYLWEHSIKIDDIWRRDGLVYAFSAEDAERIIRSQTIIIREWED